MPSRENDYLQPFSRQLRRLMWRLQSTPCLSWIASCVFIWYAKGLVVRQLQLGRHFQNNTGKGWSFWPTKWQSWTSRKGKQDRQTEKQIEGLFGLTTDGQCSLMAYLRRRCWWRYLARWLVCGVILRQASGVFRHTSTGSIGSMHQSRLDYQMKSGAVACFHLRSAHFRLESLYKSTVRLG